MEEKVKSDNLNKLNIFIALLGVSAPAGYLIGLNFYQGTLEAYEVLGSGLSL